MCLEKEHGLAQHPLNAKGKKREADAWYDSDHRKRVFNPDWDICNIHGWFTTRRNTMKCKVCTDNTYNRAEKSPWSTGLETRSMQSTSVKSQCFVCHIWKLVHWYSALYHFDWFCWEDRAFENNDEWGIQALFQCISRTPWWTESVVRCISSRHNEYQGGLAPLDHDEPPLAGRASLDDEPPLLLLAFLISNTYNSIIK